MNNIDPDKLDRILEAIEAKSARLYQLADAIGIVEAIDLAREIHDLARQIRNMAFD